MSPIKAKSLSADKKQIVGFAMVSHNGIVGSKPAVVSNGTEELEIPLTFLTGNLMLIRTEIHRLIDEMMDQLEDVK
jgi:hypothetical protein